MATKRTETLIKSATVVSWAWSHNTTNGNGVYGYTVTDDATGLSYTGKTKANAGFRIPCGNNPSKLVNVRILGKVMTTAEKG